MITRTLGALLGLTGALTLSGTVWNASLEPEGSSGITGSARVETFGGDSAMAQVTVNGAKPNTVLSWGIQAGGLRQAGHLDGGGVDLSDDPGRQYRHRHRQHDRPARGG